MDPSVVELLVLELQEGNKKAFERLYKEFNQPMRRFAFLRINDQMVAEDVVQNVWIKIGKRVEQLRDVSLFRSWLYRALRWEINDWYRSQQRLEYRDAEDKEVPPLRVEILDLKKILQRLSDEEREVVELFYLSDLSLDETAFVLSLPEGTVKSRLFRARTNLKEYFQ